MASSFALTVIPETEMSETLDRAIRDLLCRCFPEDAAAFAKSRAWHESWPHFTVLAREDASLLGHVGIVRRLIRCGAEEVIVAGVQNLCVIPQRRGAGVSQALLQAALAEAKQQAMPFGLLFCIPELAAFYRSTGWRESLAQITMLDERGAVGPLPEKNVGMQIALVEEPFPPGPIFLNGRDW
jgi:predicted N-acetyltransferase YhbS